jgi:hypothetical protein
MRDSRNAIPRDQRIGTLIAGGIFLALGLFWIVASSQIPSKAVYVGVLTAASLPYGAGILLAIISLILLVRYWRLPSRPARELGTEPLFAPGGMWRVVGTVITVIVYILILPVINYLVSTFLLMAVGLYFTGRPFGIRLVVIAAVSSIAFYLIFVMWLQVALPGSRFA